MIDADTINAAYKALEKAHVGMFNATGTVNTFEEGLAKRRAELLDSGEIDGKNAETREGQLKARTEAEAARLAVAKGNLRRAELELRCAGLEVERCKTLLKLLEVAAGKNSDPAGDADAPQAEGGNAVPCLPVPTRSEWLQTNGGVAFELPAPRLGQVRPSDVAHHLSLINRFTGALNRPYSVAQHSLVVVELLKQAGHTDPALLLQAAVHDAAEAYVGDVAAPLKRLLPDYQRVEAQVWAACAIRFGVPEKLNPAVKEADWLACRAEAWAHGECSPLDGWAGENPLPLLSSEVREVLFAECDWQVWRKRWLDTTLALTAAAEGRGGVL